MKQAAQTINSTQLRQFAPLGKLSDEDAQELLRTSITIRLSPGTPVFRKDDTDKQVFYLLKGKIEVRGENKKIVIEAGTKEARIPFGHHLPGQVSAKALDESVLVSFDADMLDLFLNWTNPNAYVVNEVETSKDHEWMNSLLQSRGLLRFTDSQMNTLLDRMNEIHVKAGDAVVSQDSNDDHYYVIKKGKATVSRKPDANAKDIKLGELREGDAFGEESILTASPRGATITMQEDGSLMRLSKQDFSELLAQPLLTTISWDQALAKVATGATFVDIRLEDEFKALNIPSSVNIPLPLMRLKMKHLNKHQKYIVYCNDGSRSSVAAFLMNRHGFDAFILDGGMATAMPHLALRQMSPLENSSDDDKTEAKEKQASEPKQDESLANEDESKSEASINETEQGKSFCSLADYWGATVEDASNDSFVDSDALHNVEKTKVTASSHSKVEAVFEEKSATKKTTVTALPLTHISQPETNPYGGSHFFRNSMIGICALGLVAALGMMQLNPEASAPNTTTTPGFTSTVMEKNEVPPARATPVSNRDPAPLSSADNQREIISQAIKMDMMIKSAEIETKETDMAEALEYHPVITPTPPKQTALDPATRGFLE